MVPLGFASQTAGSIVRPAAFCGIVGYKPTYGTINRVGAKDDLGHARHRRQSSHAPCRDAALIRSCAQRSTRTADGQAANGSPAHRTLPHITNGSERPSETVAVVEDAGRRLAQAGAKVRDITLPPSFAGLVDAQIAIMVREVALCLSHEWLVHRDKLSREMIAMIEAGLAVTTERYDAAKALARSCRAALGDVFADIDVVIAPSTVGEAPEGIHATGDPLFNRMWTLLRVPCVHLPVGGDRGGCRSASRSRGRFVPTAQRCSQRTGFTRSSSSAESNRWTATDCSRVLPQRECPRHVDSSARTVIRVRSGSA
jgi:amidase